MCLDKDDQTGPYVFYLFFYFFFFSSFGFAKEEIDSQPQKPLTASPFQKCPRLRSSLSFTHPKLRQRTTSDCVLQCRASSIFSQVRILCGVACCCCFSPPSGHLHCCLSSGGGQAVNAVGGPATGRAGAQRRAAVGIFFF